MMGNRVGMTIEEAEGVPVRHDWLRAYENTAPANFDQFRTDRPPTIYHAYRAELNDYVVGCTPNAPCHFTLLPWPRDQFALRFPETQIDIECPACADVVTAEEEAVAAARRKQQAGE